MKTVVQVMYALITCGNTETKQKLEQAVGKSLSAVPKLSGCSITERSNSSATPYHQPPQMEWTLHMALQKPKHNTFNDSSQDVMTTSTALQVQPAPHSSGKVLKMASLSQTAKLAISMMLVFAHLMSNGLMPILTIMEILVLDSVLILNLSALQRFLLKKKLFIMQLQLLL